MIKNSDIVSINSNISFDYQNCSMNMAIDNEFLTFKATQISKKGFIINRSITIKRRNNYENIVRFINGNKDVLLLLLKKIQEKTREYDEKITNIDD